MPILITTTLHTHSPMHTYTNIQDHLLFNFIAVTLSSFSTSFGIQDSTILRHVEVLSTTRHIDSETTRQHSSFRRTQPLRPLLRITCSL
eukprot:m.10972 g.10972  ORF g.10972 m.10972 type:complete len:89 (-) comp6785_c1_seq1:42-308(-)